MSEKHEINLQDVQDALKHIDAYWKKLLRKTVHKDATLIQLPNPYVVPSEGREGFSFNEQYYWDSYFTAIGLDDEKLVTGMLENLLFLYKEFGLIPNANRYYFTSRSQPPILTTYIFHVYDKYGKSDEWLQERIEIAKKEYKSVWLSEDHPHSRNVYKGLSRYYDINYLHDLAEAESGWDMTPRFQRKCLDYIPIDLNCLLYKYEADFARAAFILGDKTQERIWHRAAEQRQAIVSKVLWSKKQNFFFDYNYNEKKQSKVWSLAAYYALWSGLASKDQAQQLVHKLERFEKKGGLTTTIGNQMYYSLFGSTKAQWAYPNGWAPLHYIVTEGLEMYGYKDLAKKVACSWLKNCTQWFETNGEFQEKYNVVNPTLQPADGVYPSQSGFGWTNGVYVYYTERYLRPSV